MSVPHPSALAMVPPPAFSAPIWAHVSIPPIAVHRSRRFSRRDAILDDISTAVLRPYCVVFLDPTTAAHLLFSSDMSPEQNSFSGGAFIFFRSSGYSGISIVITFFIFFCPSLLSCTRGLPPRVRSLFSPRLQDPLWSWIS